jgi:thioesterase domain-containing protein
MGAGGCRLAVAYATTETGTIAQRLLADGEEVTWPPAVGREVEGVTVADAGGELVVTGRWLHRGYWPAVAPPGEREYRTGDLGRRREDGMLEWQGRRDEQVKLRGQRIELGEIEAALRSLENVREAVAGVVDGPAGTRRLAAWVVPANHRRVSVGAWREALRQKLPAGLVPEAFVVLGALPVGGGGKVDRRALPAPAAGPARGAGEGRPADPPQGELEQTLAGIWERVLGVAPVGRADDFFDLGGDSLLAAAIVARIEEAVGSLPPLALFLQASTVAAQAAALQKGWADIRSTVVPLAGADGGGGPVIYCVHSGEGEVFRYRALARRLAAEWGGVVYGLQSPAMRGEWPPWTFAGFARRHADDILAQARGGGAPCFIVGHCVGGILAVEIARALERAGRAVHGVVLINTPVPGKTARLRTSHWRKRWTDAVAHRVRVVRWRVRLAVDALRGAGGGGGMRGGGQRFGSAFRRFGDRAYMDALRRHRLSAYHGRVLALLAEATWDAGEDPRLAFVRACAPAACVGHVPGNHTSCLQGPHVEAVAAAMRAFLAGG